MEIATEIIKIRENYNCKNSIISVIDSIRACKLTDVSTVTMKEVDTKKIDELFSKLFITKCKPGEAVLIAYLIVNSTEHFFGSYKTTLENRLIKAAFNLVYMLEHGTDFTEFAQVFDHYNSLYTVWVKDTDLENIDNLMETVKELVHVYRLSHNKECIDKIVEMIDSLISVDKMLGVKTLFANCWDLCVVPEVLDKMWLVATDLIKTDLEQTVLILLAELRIIIINRSTNPAYKKKLYYNVDLEDLISKIQSNRLSTTHINKVFKLFCNSLSIEYVKLKRIDPDTIINYLKKLYSTVLIPI